MCQMTADHVDSGGGKAAEHQLMIVPLRMTFYVFPFFSPEVRLTGSDVFAALFG